MTLRAKRVKSMGGEDPRSIAGLDLAQDAGAGRAHTVLRAPAWG